jgi:NAD(P)-dependent dehydrogenase (short-subunit alcohol dehydrogenase family)
MSRLDGRVCLVTGGTRGIGFEITRGLARLGAHVLIVGRDATRGRQAVERIGASRAELLLADLSSQQSIHELAAQVHRRHDRLHVLVNNAGGLFARRSSTVDGLEQTLALNHLAYYLLTVLLLDLLRAGAPSRIVNVASQAHERGWVDFEDLQSRRRYGGLTAYRASKLENLWFTYELARRLEGSGVTVNAMHPGTAATDLGLQTPGWFKWVKTILRPFFRSPITGASTAIHLATSSDVEGVTGSYFVDCRPRSSSPLSRDRAAQQRLWTMSEALTHAGLPNP